MPAPRRGKATRTDRGRSAARANPNCRRSACGSDAGRPPVRPCGRTPSEGFPAPHRRRTPWLSSCCPPHCSAGSVDPIHVIRPGTRAFSRVKMAGMPDTPYPISILDLAIVERGSTPRDALVGSVALAQRAEARGYERVWYAEHHNMAAIASSATSVLIAHVAAHTNTIRLGSGGIMLPNHSPLVIAEQFGTLASLHPGRIDLGLGRAPGSDQNTMHALRRSGLAAERFPQDVLELQGYLSGHTLIEGVEATPGKGTDVPLYILGSSTFGAQLAAALGLPYAFASHFAPYSLEEAVAVYRREFRPSAQLDAPCVIAGVNVIAADSDADAQEK